MDAAELRDIAAGLGFRTDPVELAPLEVIVRELLEDCERLDELDRAHPSPRPPERGGYRPQGDENPVNGWVWRCDVRGAGGGPLAGRTVALKDNIALAGAPL